MEAGCKTVYSLGGLQFLQCLKSDIPLDCHPIIDAILEQLYTKCHSSEPELDTPTPQVVYKQSEESHRDEKLSHATGSKRSDDKANSSSKFPKHFCWLDIKCVLTFTAV